MLTVRNLSKTYPSFSLQDVSFDLHPGFITGFIGVNGAGKTTTLKSIMNMVRPDSGTVTFAGLDLHAHEAEAKQRIGFMLGPVDVYPKHTVRTIVDVYRRFYLEWDGGTFGAYLERFGIDDRKRISELSTGMRVKLGISMALSHGASLLLLDEPTSGLDPVARDDLLDLLAEVVDDGERSVLFSTHITTDLDKIADYVVHLRGGRVIADDAKDDLLAAHVHVGGRHEDLTEQMRRHLVGHKSHAFGFTGLARASQLEHLRRIGPLQTQRPTLENLMTYYELEDAR